MSIIADAAPPRQSTTEAVPATSTPAALAPAAGGDWLTELDLLQEIPVCRRTLKQWRDAGVLPFVRLPGSRRIIYHRASVEAALLRHERGGAL
ncbi:MAG: hypothetical protein ACLQM8_18105 [Limisphaerales bacterium]